MAHVTRFTRAARRNILTIDLVKALADTMRTEDDRALPRNTRRCIDRVNARIKNIQEIIYSGPTLALAPGHYKKYARIVMSIKKLIDNIGSDVVELDFFNAVLVLVEDARLACRRSKNIRLQREWNFLNQSLATLYGHVDPDLSQIKWMALGDNLAGRFRRIIMAK